MSQRYRGQLHLGQMTRPCLIQTALSHLPRRFTRWAEVGWVDVLGVYKIGAYQCIIIRFTRAGHGQRAVSHAAVSEHRQPGGGYRFKARQIERVPWADYEPGLYPSDRERAVIRAQKKGREKQAHTPDDGVDADQTPRSGSAVAPGTQTDTDDGDTGVCGEAVQHPAVKTGGRRVANRRRRRPSQPRQKGVSEGP